jgi:superfamily II DNA or RNA helicase
MEKSLEDKAWEIKRGLNAPKEYLLGLASSSSASKFEECLDNFKFASNFSLFDHIELELAMRKLATRDVHVAFLQVLDFALSRNLVAFDVFQVDELASALRILGKFPSKHLKGGTSTARRVRFSQSRPTRHATTTPVSVLRAPLSTSTTTEQAKLEASMKQTWKKVQDLRKVYSNNNIKQTCGTPSFDQAFGHAFRAQIAEIESLVPTCDDSQLKNYQQGAVLACTVLDRVLVVHATGSGKTRIMHSVLDNKLGDIRPKVVLVPNEKVRDNFYKDVVTYQTVMGKYATFNRRSNETTEDTLSLKQPLILEYKTRCQAYNISATTSNNNVAYNAPLRAFVFANAYHVATLSGNQTESFSKMEANKPCFKRVGDQYTIFKPDYGLTQNDRQNDEPRLNPFNNKIIVVDEAHELLANTSENTILLEALRTAVNSQVYFFTATPVDESRQADKSNNPLLAVVKNQRFANLRRSQTDAQNLAFVNTQQTVTTTNHGFVSFYYKFDEPFYPRTIPFLNVLHLAPDEELPELVLGRIVFTKLHHENEAAYRLLHKSNQTTIDKLVRATTSKYNDSHAAHYTYNMLAKKEDFFRSFNKLECMVKHLMTKLLKTVVVFTSDGAAAFQAFLKAKHASKLFEAQTSSAITRGYAPTSSSVQTDYKIGFLLHSDDQARRKAVLATFNDPNNLQGQKLGVLCVTQEFGTGTDFHAVRRIILTGPPRSASAYFQFIGRGLRLCKHFALPLEDRTMEVEILVATLESTRRLSDLETITDGLTIDETMLVQLRNDVRKYRSDLAEFSKDAIDKSWYKAGRSASSFASSNDDLESMCDATTEDNQAQEATQADTLLEAAVVPEYLTQNASNITNTNNTTTTNSNSTTHSNTTTIPNSNNNLPQSYLDLNKEYQKPKPAEIQITTKKTIRTDEEELSLARVVFGDINVKLLPSSAPTEALLRDELLIDIQVPTIFIHPDIDAAKNQIGMEASGFTMISVINDFPRLIDEAATLRARQERDEELAKIRDQELAAKRAEQAKLEELERLEALKLQMHKKPSLPNPAEPTSNQVKPTSNQVKPTSNQVKPTSNQVKPTSNQVKPTSNQVKPTSNQVNPKSAIRNIPRSNNNLQGGQDNRRKLRRHTMVMKGGAQAKPNKVEGNPGPPPIVVFYFDDTAVRFVTASLVYKLTRLVSPNTRVVDYYNRNFVGTNMAKWDRVVGLHIHYMPFVNKVYLVWQPNVHMVRPVMYVNREALLKSFGERVDAMRAAQLYESIVEYRGPLERTLWSEGAPLLESDELYTISTEVRVPDLVDSQTMQTVQVVLALKNELAKQGILEVYKELLARAFSTDEASVLFVEARADKLVFRTSNVPGALLQQRYEDYVNPILLSPPSNVAIEYGHRTLFFKAFNYISDVNQFVRHNLGSQIARLVRTQVSSNLLPPLRTQVMLPNMWVLISKDVRIMTVQAMLPPNSLASNQSFYANDPAYIKAKQDQKVGVILRESNASFVTTTVPYKSLYDFARSATDDTWNEFWYFCLETKQRAEEAYNTQVWLYTEVVPHKGFRVMFSRTDPTPQVEAQVAQEQVKLLQQQQLVQQQLLQQQLFQQQQFAQQQLAQQQVAQQQVAQQQVAQQQVAQQQVAQQQVAQQQVDKTSHMIVVHFNQILQSYVIYAKNVNMGIDAFPTGSEVFQAYQEANKLFGYHEWELHHTIIMPNQTNFFIVKSPTQFWELQNDQQKIDGWAALASWPKHGFLQTFFQNAQTRFQLQTTLN